MIGNILKMKVQLSSPVQYQLPVDDELIDMNSHIGGNIKLDYQGEINDENMICAYRDNTDSCQGERYVIVIDFHCSSLKENEPHRTYKFFFVSSSKRSIKSAEIQPVRYW